jgi:hypothetical protein
VALGRAGGVALDPSTGAAVRSGLPWVRAAFQRINELHRWFALSGDGRAIGEAVTGGATLLFLGLLLTGPFLWLPRRWTRASLRSIGWFRSGLRGRPRDWNWHHVLRRGVSRAAGVAFSGVVMSYRWANDTVYRAMGGVPRGVRRGQLDAPAPGTGASQLVVAGRRAAPGLARAERPARSARWR